MLKHLLRSAAFASLAVAAGVAQAADKLPSTLVTTAYNTGTSGYSQMVAVGAMLKNKVGVNLRVLPGKNDVSRLSPVKAGKAQFTATGSDSIYAQEAVYTFGTDTWGPMPIRLLLVNRSNGCTNFAVAGDIGVKTMADLKGKRIGWVRGSPALQKAAESLLAFANVSLDEVQLVEIGGWAASINGIIDGDIDASITATQSTFMLKMEASPRGVMHPPLPHDNAEGWARVQKIVPWYYKGTCIDGPGNPEGGQDGVASIYPILISTSDVSDGIAYGMTKAMIDNFEDYKEGAPGAYGWALDRQIEDFYLPTHPGAIRFFKEKGAWSAKAQENHDKQMQRQAVLMKAWKAHVKSPGDDFDKGWMSARAKALTDAGFDPVFTEW
ncbi:MAG: TAXI family TRAP transporter solute-binding subunit [Alphaproteobacteria bacterium]